MEYYVNDRTGEVHREDCRRRVKDRSPWDPAKQHLTPGVFACGVCLTGGLPGVPVTAPTPETGRAGESDAIPETVGYRESFVEVEYGVFADRRRFGHGFMLLRTTKSPSAAQEYAERAVGSRDNAAQIGPEDVHIRARQVTFTPWSAPVIPPTVTEEASDV